MPKGRQPGEIPRFQAIGLPCSRPMLILKIMSTFNRLPVGTFLSATLIGMSVGQRMPLLKERGIAGEVQVLAVHAQLASERLGHD